MQDDSSTFGLNREKLSKLWQLGDDLPPDQDDLDVTHKKTELLQQQLAESLPLDAGMAHMLPDLLNAVCEKLIVLRAVVVDLQVTQLMHDDVFDAVQWSLHQVWVEQYSPCLGAASPSFLHLSN